MWITGFQAGLIAATAKELKDYSVCLPNEFTGEQAILIVKKFMNEHPQLLHAPASQVTFLALYSAFRCSNPPN
jgi:hypothetical protein